MDAASLARHLRLRLEVLNSAAATWAHSLEALAKDPDRDGVLRAEARTASEILRRHYPIGGKVQAPGPNAKEPD